MRKITSESVSAFYNGFTFSKQNIEVSIHYGIIPEIEDYKGNHTKLKLHGNTIAILLTDTHKLYITNAGWKSNTTKERLNALDGVSILQRNFVWYLNGEEWDGELTEV